MKQKFQYSEEFGFETYEILEIVKDSLKQILIVFGKKKRPFSYVLFCYLLILHGDKLQWAIWLTYKDIPSDKQA